MCMSNRSRIGLEIACLHKAQISVEVLTTLFGQTGRD
jgi:hypothetical protein